ncbi:hypothetical protein JXA05_04540 [Candidatus Peregrinibacteria bacterium]|nr:hypothetical protein [Candidatus Peregrinibacteria bacterium]
MAEEITAITGFDPEYFLDSLIKDMGMGNEAEENKNTLKDAMRGPMFQAAMDAAAMGLEPEVIDMVSAELEGEKDPVVFIRELIDSSPACQTAILEALDKFYNETLETFNTLKKP